MSTLVGVCEASEEEICDVNHMHHNIGLRRSLISAHARPYW
jgi:hypothetical protein